MVCCGAARSRSVWVNAKAKLAVAVLQKQLTILVIMMGDYAHIFDSFRTFNEILPVPSTEAEPKSTSVIKKNPREQQTINKLYSAKLVRRRQQKLSYSYKHLNPKYSFVCFRVRVGLVKNSVKQFQMSNKIQIIIK